MADDKEKPVEVSEKKDSTDEAERRSESKLGWYIALIVAAVVIFMLGVLVDHAVNYHNANRVFVSSNVSMPRTGSFRGNYYGSPSVSSNQVQISGVVTAVNGSTFTVAGNGTNNTVQTNSNTQYYNATKVSLNDSVAVVGTTNNGTFTASQVIINNQ